MADRTALVVVIPEAEPAVRELRLQLDSSARLGVPAHVSVLFPFLPAVELADDVSFRLSALLRTAPAFETTFETTAWFGEEVLWLAPEAADGFRRLTQLVWDAFPACPPYGGQFAEVVPHLTVADHGPLEAMRAADRTVGSQLPIRARVGAVTLLLERPSGRWEAVESFALGD